MEHSKATAQSQEQQPTTLSITRTSIVTNIKRLWKDNK